MLAIGLGVYVQDAIAVVQELGVGAREWFHTRPVAVQYLDLVVRDIKLSQRRGHCSRYIDLAEEVVGEVQHSELGAETGEIDGDVLDQVVGEIESRETLKHLFPTAIGLPLNGEVGVAYIKPVIQTSLSDLVDGYHFVCFIGTLRA